MPEYISVEEITTLRKFADEVGYSGVVEKYITRYTKPEYEHNKVYELYFKDGKNKVFAYWNANIEEFIELSNAGVRSAEHDLGGNPRPFVKAEKVNQ